MELRYDVWKSKDILELFKKIIENSITDPTKNTQTELSFFFRKSGGTIGDRLSSLSSPDVGLLSKRPSGRNVIYEPNLEIYIKKINNELLESNFKLEQDEIKKLAVLIIECYSERLKKQNEVLKEAPKMDSEAVLGLMDTLEEEAGILNMIQEDAVSLKIASLLAKERKLNKRGVLFAINSLPFSNSDRAFLQHLILNIPEAVAKKLEHLKTPKNVNTVLAFINLLSKGKPK